MGSTWGMSSEFKIYAAKMSEKLPNISRNDIVVDKNDVIYGDKTIDQSNPFNQKCFTVATNIFNEGNDDNKSRCFKSERYEDRSDSNVTSHIIEKLIFFILFDRESFTITY